VFLLHGKGRGPGIIIGGNGNNLRVRRLEENVTFPGKGGSYIELILFVPDEEAAASSRQKWGLI
jgi:hypothetical protein